MFQNAAQIQSFSKCGVDVEFHLGSDARVAGENDLSTMSNKAI